MHIKHGIQLRELEQVHHLAPGIAQFQLPPRLSLPTLALRTRVPVAVVVFENRSAALPADHLRDRTERHDQLSKTAAIDVRHVLEVQQNFRVSLRHFVTNSLSERSQRVACRDSSGKIHDEYGV